MDTTSLILDTDRLRSVARRIERAAASPNHAGSPVAPTEALPDSAIAAVRAPELLADRLTALIADIRGWAGAARGVVGDLEAADLEAADTIGHR